MIVGALCSIAVIGYVNELPGAVLIPLGLLLGAVGGGLWGALAGWIHVRLGVNVVIATLLLVFIAEPLAHVGGARPAEGPRDVPAAEPGRRQRRAAAPRVDRRPHRRPPRARRRACGGLAVSSTRLGYLVRAHGGNRTATTANEVRPGRLPLRR